MSKWKMVKLGEVSDVVSGFAFDSKQFTDDSTAMPIIRIRDVVRGFTETYTTERYDKKYVVKKGDLLIGMDGEFNIAEWKSEPALLNQRVCKIFAGNVSIIEKYLLYFMPAALKSIEDKTPFVTVKHISVKQIKEIIIPLPPIEEQKRIADILDKASNLIDLRKQQLEKMDLLIKSKFIDMFGDPVTNPKGWEIEKLGKHISVIGGYAFKSNGFSAHGIPVLRIGNINSGFFKSSNLVFWNEDKMLARYLLKPGDMVISLTGTVGKDDYGNVCILSNDYSQYYLNQRNAKLEIRNTIEKQYLSNILKIPKIKNELTDISRGVRQANISNADILNLCIPVPPIELQNQFSEFVEKVEKQKAVMQQSLEKMEINYKALMQEYFG